MAADPKETSVKEEATEVANSDVAVADAPAKAKSGAAAVKLSAQQLIHDFEAAQKKSELPDIYVGDTVRVGVRISEGNKERVQPYEGVVIAKRHGGINETITVRRIFQALVLSVFSCSIAPKSPPSRSSVAVKCVGRSFSICVTGWARPLRVKQRFDR